MKKLSVVMLVCLVSGFYMQSVHAMRQPAMENAMRALDNAERMLRKALPNKGGHRAKALRHIKKAKQEIIKGIEFANRRGAGGQYKNKKGANNEGYHQYKGKVKAEDDVEEKAIIKKRY